MRYRYPRHLLRFPPRRPRRAGGRVLSWINSRNILFIFILLATIPAVVLLVNALVKNTQEGNAGATSAGNQAAQAPGGGLVPASTPTPEPLRCLGDQPFTISNLAVQPGRDCCVATISGEAKNVCNKVIKGAVRVALKDFSRHSVVASGLTDASISAAAGASTFFSVEVNLHNQQNWEGLQRNQFFPTASALLVSE